MPNTPVWGHPQGQQELQQDLISPLNPQQGDHAVIKVNDVNNNDADRPAIFAKNSNNGANARALKVEGVSELDGKVIVPDQELDDVAVQITNNSSDPDGKALSATGQVKFTLPPVIHAEPLAALQLVDQAGGESDRALKVDGKTEFDGKVIVPDLNVNDAEVQVTNSNAGENARALRAVGVSEISATGTPGSKGLKVTNSNGHGSSRALEVVGQTTMVNQEDGDVAYNTLNVESDNLHPGFGSLFVKGTTALHGVGTEREGWQSFALLVKNELEEGVTRVAIVTQEAPSVFEAPLHIQNIDGGSPFGDQSGPLNLGTGNNSTDVTIGNEGHDVEVADDLNVGGDLDVDGSLTVGAAPLPR